MQGKGIVKFFAILMVAVCLYQFSFTWVVNKVQSNADAYARGNTAKRTAYLDSIATQPVYPILGFTYQYCQSNELALGLDLQGGMSVTLQVELRQLVKALSNNSPDVYLNQALDRADMDARTSQSDYITLFVNEYEKLNPNGKLAVIFANKDNQEHIKFSDNNTKAEAYLKEQADVAVQQTYTVINTRIDQFGVTNPNVQLLKDKNQILIELPGVTEPERIRKLLQNTAKLEFYKTFDNQEASTVLTNINNLIAAKAKTAKKDTTVNKDTSAKAIAAKKDTTSKGANALLQKMTKNSAKDTSSLLKGKAQALAQNPFFAVLTPNFPRSANELSPVVGYAMKKDTARVDAYLNSPDVKNTIPQNMRFLWGVKPINDKISSQMFKDNEKHFELYAMKLQGVDNSAALGGDVVTDARSDIDPNKGGWEVTMYMNSQGARQWEDITAEAAPRTQNERGKAIAIVLDNNVYSAPAVDNKISGGVSSISGNFTQEETKDLANVLKAGSLPARAVIVSEATVGASMGQQAIHAGLLSSVLGFVVVLIFMIAYYNRGGTVAVMAVIVNVFFLMGVLVGIGAVLTMPGVAGIVLTLGISVDANVLIYERVREEMGTGKSLKLAIADGFKHALSSILDSNISTFLTGLILFVFGSGPIKGFAVVLMIGIGTSLFCSLLISRLILEWMIKKGWDIKFSNPWSSHTFKNANYGFVKNRKWFYIFSTSFITLGIISMFTQGFNYGVDFVGGRNYIVHFDNPGVTTEKVRNVIEPVLGASEVKTFSTFGGSRNSTEISITTKYLIEDNSTAADSKVRAALVSALSKNNETRITDDVQHITGYQKVKATIAEGLKQSAFWTVLIAIIIISSYILIRFRKWQFSLGAMIATAHDALMVLSFFSIFKFVPWLDLDIDQSFIAAILTVIGYSINDTVVVFDRIREFLNLHHAATDDPKEVINHAINKTLSRTIITALTVLFVLIVLFIFGGDVIRGFSFALLVGVCFGTYSSICIATPVIIDFGKKDLK
ncbi:MAG TPA: protein translocase subunit SecDF [Mucilaginibacter sp.]|jgi:SecD/SecF fusion protein|nr:protein translocase subunit SecDF [Mucilaginibacter sp.]